MNIESRIGYSGIGLVKKVPVKTDDVMNAAFTAMNAEHAALSAAGYSDNAIRNTLVKDYMESGAYTNKGYKLYNNPGNIMYSEHDPWATKGGYNSVNKTYYASYKNLNDYALANKRVLSLAPGRPIDASSYADFAHRLKMNNYYGKESEASYLAKLNSTAQRLRIISSLDTDTHQDIASPYRHWYDLFTDLPWYGKAAVGVGALLLLKGIFRD